MVSSPTNEIQDKKQSPRSHINTQIKDKRSHLLLQRGSKPLAKKAFYLDIKNHALSAKLESKIKELGGKIELFLVRSVNLVVSDRVDKRDKSESLEKEKWVCASGGSGGYPSLRSIEASTPIRTPATPYAATERLFFNSAANPRSQPGQRSKSRVDAMLERALTQPQQCSVDPLNNAQSWGIPIWAVDKLQSWIEKIFASLKDARGIKCDKTTKSVRSIKVKRLKEPFIKFESYSRDTRPVFLELPSWPKINFDSQLGVSPFDTQRQDTKKLETKIKEIEENRENADLVNKEKEKEMTRRPRATAPRTRRTEQLASGYCEICRVDYKDLSRHIQSEQHLRFVQNNDNFLSLDKLINTGASVETFLKLNQSKDVGKGCELFSTKDRNDLLPLDKLKNKSELNPFNDQELNMVQCNGMRRNINLSLSSPHNLRTRTKHESGHSLRSKGKTSSGVERDNKLYDKFEGFTIKKRAKGTIWLEEDSDKDSTHEDNVTRQDGCEQDILLHGFVKSEPNNENEPKVSINVNSNNQQDVSNSKMCESVRRLSNGYNEKSDCMQVDNGGTSKEDCRANSKSYDAKLNDEEREVSILCNGLVDKFSPKDLKLTKRLAKDCQPERGRTLRGRRGSSRSNFRGRQRLSVEERLIEDNRAYYKVEVLGNKLRSSGVPSIQIPPLPPSLPSKETIEKLKKEESEKPMVVRFKRVRKSELSLLSDEAESFMFGEPKREDSSELSEDEQSSLLPKDTSESERDGYISFDPNSSEVLNDHDRLEDDEDDSQDSIGLGRARKKRRTHAEALIKDNVDYYKFETPGSRLRYQGSVTGVKQGKETLENAEKTGELVTKDEDKIVEKFYPSKPSAEIEKMHFSFESVPRSEPWYQTYQRQDHGAEYWHCFSESDDHKPFLLPYEIDNFHETLMKSISKNEARKRGRSRGGSFVARSPRKSPRCHASTLAIMSTIIRKREQQQVPNLCVIKEESSSSVNIDVEIKSDLDEQFKEMAKNIDEMLCSQEMQEFEDSFELDNSDVSMLEATIPKGAPINLLELLENCHAMVPIIEYSSCASSDCGEAVLELPQKRRKKRKNKTGWPGNRLRRKFCPKPPSECTAEKAVKERVESVLDSLSNEQQGITNRDKQTIGAKIRRKTTAGKHNNHAIAGDSAPSSEVASTDEGIKLERRSKKEGEEKISIKCEVNEGNKNEDDEMSLAKRLKPGSERSEEDCENHVITNARTGPKKRPRPNTSSEYSKTETENEPSNIVPKKKKNSFNSKRKRRSKNCKTRSCASSGLENDVNNMVQKGLRVIKDKSQGDELREQTTTPIMSSSDLEQKRSSMEFQPVVRVMKIDDHVDMDNGNILSVAVASNRRLRSSGSSPKMNGRASNKRFKTGRGQFRRLIKNS